MLGGCSEYYFDRRDTISLHSGEAMAANRVTQMIDPWPPASANRNIAYNGEKAADRVGALPHRPRHPAGERHHQLGGLHARRSSRRNPTANSQASSAPTPAATATARPSNRTRKRNANANGQVFERGEQDRGGGAHRRSGVRAVGARRPSAPAAQIELRVVSGTVAERRRRSTPRASPSSSSISTPAAPRRWRRWSG